MASFTGVGDNVTLTVPSVGETCAVALSGTYNMTIQLEREVGSPGSGAYKLMKKWTTANATVAYNFTNDVAGQKYRLIVAVDNSGTCTATLSNSGDDLLVQKFEDDAGNTIMQVNQASIDFEQALDVNAPVDFGDVITGPAPVNCTSSTLSATAALHAGKVVRLNRAAGITVTLPAAAGTGNVYTFSVGTTVTSNAYVIQVANATDTFGGGVAISTDVGGVTELAVAGDDTITMNGSTTGGLIGSWVRVTDVVAGLWMLEGFLCSSGSEGTCFSAAVS
jgi:hypothetical protein